MKPDHTNPHNLISPTAQEHLQNAYEKLSWAVDELENMKEAGLSDDLPKCQRAFSRILSDTNIAFTSIDTASKEMDGGAVSRAIWLDRKRDALLFYLWHARNVDVHHVLKRDLTDRAWRLDAIAPGSADSLVSGATCREESDNRVWCAAFGVYDIKDVPD